MKPDTREELLWAYGNGWRDFTEADLSGMELRNQDLRQIYLIRADMRRINLRGTDLRGACLNEADLTWANLADVSLARSSLVGITLCGTILNKANLYGANLCRAHLDGANLYQVRLDGANLYQARYSPIALLTAIHWGNLSRELTRELMKWDEECRVFDGPPFIKWAKETGAACPFRGSERRAFTFQENRKHYRHGKPKMRLVEVFRAACKEKNINLDDPGWNPPPLDEYEMYTETNLSFC